MVESSDSSGSPDGPRIISALELTGTLTFHHRSPVLAVPATPDQVDERWTLLSTIVLIVKFVQTKAGTSYTYLLPVMQSMITIEEVVLHGFMSHTGISSST
jgi:hypothetical protein